ncbi:MAG: twin-arginine translocase subunit TatC [Lentisphaerae bacterium]|nr:twin-arginine translocase subunit TatC [Lentisphaerota bacterium]
MRNREPQSFLEHLEDLRRAVIGSAAALAAGMAAALPLAPWMLELLRGRLAAAGENPDTFLRVLQVAGGFSIAMRLVFWGGLLLAMPFIVLAVGGFVFPGLTRRERKTVVRAGGAAVLLFAAGAAMGYFVTLPVALRLMFRINRWLGVTCEFVELADYVAFVLKLLISFGLAFELPVVIVALGFMGILSSAQLRARRRHVIVGLTIASMLLTPPDPLTLLLMAVPLAALYESCIWILWWKEKAWKP